jgi:hypothetical protein
VFMLLVCQNGIINIALFVYILLTVLISVLYHTTFYLFMYYV